MPNILLLNYLEITNFRTVVTQKVILPEDLPYPILLKNLVIGTTTSTKKFFKSIRSYNNAFAFVSFGATFDKLFSQGP